MSTWNEHLKDQEEQLRRKLTYVYKLHKFLGSDPDSAMAELFSKTIKEVKNNEI